MFYKYRNMNRKHFKHRGVFCFFILCSSSGGDPGANNDEAAGAEKPGGQFMTGHPDPPHTGK